LKAFFAESHIFPLAVPDLEKAQSMQHCASCQLIPCWLPAHTKLTH